MGATKKCARQWDTKETARRLTSDAAQRDKRLECPEQQPDHWRTRTSRRDFDFWNDVVHAEPCEPRDVVGDVAMHGRMLWCRRMQR